MGKKKLSDQPKKPRAEWSEEDLEKREVKQAAGSALNWFGVSV